MSIHNLCARLQPVLGLLLAAAAGQTVAAPLLLNPDPFLNISANEIGLPTPDTPSTRGLFTPSTTPVQSTLVALFDPLGSIGGGGPAPPKDEVEIVAADYVNRMGNLSTLNVSVFVPSGSETAFDGLVPELQALFPALSINLSFQTPAQLNTCFFSPGGVNTCVPQTPNPSAGVGNVFYLGLFDWANFGPTQYVYSLLNLDSLVVLDSRNIAPAMIHLAPDAPSRGVVSYLVDAYDPAQGGAAFVGAVPLVAALPEPGSLLLAATALLAWRLGRRSA